MAETTITNVPQEAMAAQNPRIRRAMQMTDVELAKALHGWGHIKRWRERLGDWLTGDTSLAIGMEFYARVRGAQQWKPPVDA